MSTKARTKPRVILHVDMDCFYASVEQARLGIPLSMPLAVQQWEGLIAINYAARARGIKRHDRVAVAKQKCPELVLVHVETIGCLPGSSRSSGKVSLERYRQASLRVFELFREFCPQCERASVDEAYFDVSSQAEKMMAETQDWALRLQELHGRMQLLSDDDNASMSGGKGGLREDLAPEDQLADLDANEEEDFDDHMEPGLDDGGMDEAEAEARTHDGTPIAGRTDGRGADGREGLVGPLQEPTLHDGVPAVQLIEGTGAEARAFPVREAWGPIMEGKGGQSQVEQGMRGEEGPAGEDRATEAAVAQEGHSGEPKSGEPRSGEPNAGEPKSGEPRPRLKILGGELDVNDPGNQSLLAAVFLALRLQEQILVRLGYTLSVGIAHNKLLAKMASGMTKPLGMTMVPQSVVPRLMCDLPLQKIRLLGGKLGEELTGMGFETAGQVELHLSLGFLTSRFGDRLGNYIWHAVRGEDLGQVEVKAIPKSMLAAKSFPLTSSMQHIRRWVSILAQELAERMLRDTCRNKRMPHHFHVYYRADGRRFGEGGDKSKSVPMPSAVIQLLIKAASHDASAAPLGFVPPQAHPTPCAEPAPSHDPSTAQVESVPPQTHPASCADLAASHGQACPTSRAELVPAQDQSHPASRAELAASEDGVHPAVHAEPAAPFDVCAAPLEFATSGAHRDHRARPAPHTASLQAAGMVLVRSNHSPSNPSDGAQPAREEYGVRGKHPYETISSTSADQAQCPVIKKCKVDVGADRVGGHDRVPSTTSPTEDASRNGKATEGNVSVEGEGHGQLASSDGEDKSPVQSRAHGALELLRSAPEDGQGHPQMVTLWGVHMGPKGPSMEQHVSPIKASNVASPNGPGKAPARSDGASEPMGINVEDGQGHMQMVLFEGEGIGTDMEFAEKWKEFGSSLCSALEEAGMKILSGVKDRWLPSSRLAISATGFEPLPSKGTRPINQFFGRPRTKTNKPQDESIEKSGIHAGVTGRAVRDGTPASPDTLPGDSSVGEVPTPNLSVSRRHTSAEARVGSKRNAEGLGADNVGRIAKLFRNRAGRAEAHASGGAEKEGISGGRHADIAAPPDPAQAHGVNNSTEPAVSGIAKFFRERAPQMRPSSIAAQDSSDVGERLEPGSEAGPSGPGQDDPGVDNSTGPAASGIAKFFKRRGARERRSSKPPQDSSGAGKALESEGEAAPFEPRKDDTGADDKSEAAVSGIAKFFKEREAPERPGSIPVQDSTSIASKLGSERAGPIGLCVSGAVRSAAGEHSRAAQNKTEADGKGRGGSAGVLGSDDCALERGRSCASSGPGEKEPCSTGVDCSDEKQSPHHHQTNVPSTQAFVEGRSVCWMARKRAADEKAEAEHPEGISSETLRHPRVQGDQEAGPMQLDFGTVRSEEMGVGKVDSGEGCAGKVDSAEGCMGKVDLGEGYAGKVNLGEVDMGGPHQGEVDLGQVDLEEQERILAQIQQQQRAARGDRGHRGNRAAETRKENAAKGAAKKGGAPKGQFRIADLLQAKSRR